MVGNRNVRSVTPETSNYEDPKTEPMDIDFSSSGHSSELLPPIQIEALTSATSKSVYDTVTPVGRIPTSLPWSNTTGNALRTPETAPVLEDFDLEILEIPEIPEVTVEVQSPVPNSSAQSIEMDFVKGESKYDNFKLALKDDLPEPAPIEKEVIRDPLEVCLEQNLPPEIWKIIEPVVKDINLRKDDVFTRVISFLFSEETPNIGSVDFLNYMAGEDKRSILPSNIIDSIEDSWGNLIERIIWL